MTHYLKKLKNLLPYSFLVITLIFVYLYTKNYSYLPKSSNSFEGKLIDYKISDDKVTLYLKNSETIVANYYGKIDSLKLGGIYAIEGLEKALNSNTNFYLFSYKNYLLSKGIKRSFLAEKISLKGKNTNIFYTIKNKIVDRIKKIENKEYLSLFLLGDSSLVDSDMKKLYQGLGISHLFAISGMHVGLFLMLLKRILFFIKNENKMFIICCCFLLFYSFLANFSPSILRATLFYILIYICKKIKFNIKNENILIILFCLFLIYRPFFIYNISFLFSFIISYFLLILSKSLSYIKQIFYNSFIATIASIPIISISYFKINICSLFFNVIYIPLISYFVFPFTLLSFFLPFGKILKKILCCLELLSNFVSRFSIFITVPHMPLILIIIYYIFLFFCINKKRMLIICIFILLYSNFKSFKNYPVITVLDVGQGDSILIQLPHNQGNILIDTGGTYTFSTAEQILIPYLYASGISNIDYLIFSHGDFDHMGDSITLIKNFKINEVIFNNDEYNDLELDLIELLKSKNIPYYKNIDKLNIGNNQFYFFNTKIYDNENDNSNVIYSVINGKKVLFMGDAGVDKEKDILEKYNIKDIDFLKVGHHGSNTSSSEEFIKVINPKYSLISVGKNNRYGHPKESVLKTLSNSTVYRTDKDGSIEIKFNKNGYKIRTCSSN